MTKRIIAFLLLAVLMCGMLAACKEDKLISADEAKAIALQDMGITEEQAKSVDIHPAVSGGEPLFSIYITYGNKNMEYVINAKTGEIISKGESNHSHSH